MTTTTRALPLLVLLLAVPLRGQEATGAADTDGDGLTDEEELALSTDPSRRDTDADTVPDRIEVLLGLDPRAPDTDDDFIDDGDERLGDSDEDGLLDALESAIEDLDRDEFAAEQDAAEDDPCAPSRFAAACDRDGDGLINLVEQSRGTDPGNVDTDEDGASDLVEDLGDADGDGQLDALESRIRDGDHDGVVDERDPRDTDPCAPRPTLAACFGGALHPVPPPPPPPSGESANDRPARPARDRHPVPERIDDAFAPDTETEQDEPSDDGIDDEGVDRLKDRIGHLRPAPLAPSGQDDVEQTDDPCAVGVDQDADGLVDACDPDADGDGFPDDQRLDGGGLLSCAQSSTSPSAWLTLVLLLLFLRRRTMLPALTASAMLHVSLGTTPAFAAPVPVLNADRIQLSHDSGGILDIEAAHVERDLGLDVALSSAYALNPLVLRDSEGARGAAYVEHRATGALQAQVSLFRRAALGVAMPAVLFQTEGRSPLLAEAPAPAAVGLGDLRITPKLVIVRPADLGFGLALSTSVTVPTATRGSLAGHGGLTISPELLASIDLGAARFAAGVGAVLRDRVHIANTDVGSELRWRVGASIPLPMPLSTELQASLSGASPLGTRASSPLEALLGAQVKVAGAISLFVAAGSALSSGVGAADLRAMGGLRIEVGGERKKEEPVEVRSAPPAIAPARPSTATLARHEDRSLEPLPPILPVVPQFAFGDARVSAAARAELHGVARLLADHPQATLLVIGHTDALGEARMNESLSLRRARAVVEVLVSLGVARERLVAQGAGERQPLASNATEKGRQKNRRVELHTSPAR